MNISGFSTARYSTWYFLEEHRVLFDAGDGVSVALGPKCQKVQHVFLSHADRDHIGGLLQLNQLGARAVKPLSFYYPKDSGSFPALRNFIDPFDPWLAKSVWTPVEAGMRIQISKQHVVEIGENDHIAVTSPHLPRQVKSLDFSLLEMRKRLRAEFQGLDGEIIKRLRREYGDAHISEKFASRLFGFSGDAPHFDIERWRGTSVLIHETTFIKPDHGNRGHCELGDVLRAARQLDLKALILSHFSERYEVSFIKAEIVRLAAGLEIGFPVFAVPPRTTVFDILSQEPVWSPIQL